MAFTQTELDTLDIAIASGTLRVKFQDREVEYRSMKDLLAARTLILAGLNGPTTRQIRLETNSGL